MLGMRRKPPEVIKREREEQLNGWIKTAAKFRKLTMAEGTGWKEFCELLQNRLDACKKRKAITALDQADDKTIFQLKLLDHEIYITSMILNIPKKFIINLEIELKKQKERADG